jgi:CrcB protein
MRWWLSVLLNPIMPSLPLGTLTANLMGGYLMGVAMAVMEHSQTLSPELRLLVTTGFLGGLTTFSAFSAEATTFSRSSSTDGLRRSPRRTWQGRS